MLIAATMVFSMVSCGSKDDNKGNNPTSAPGESSTNNGGDTAEGNKKEVAYKLLEDVGIDKETADRRVNRLSGGEQQRTAIARALSTDPEIIMADEPTGNLDHETSGEIIELLMRLAHERDKCVIVVTHDLKIAEKSDVILQLDTEKKAFTVKHNMTGYEW